ncbi:peptide-methionine (R)-S-oxide reductase [Sphingomonas gellani]|uniref:peptide-methionine (R)-S-oxide reductase n=1 Tax=Sphingomonas gellani TaxID=1166340 RepID=A0A1H8G3S3_9SPHN|nr:peptide-methionine (R)-S-oxide reductase MsrB [Sphingomonas gellani]SEN38539.1 peptide-methionine (R)-S-oxide reductase [Sphingomonas gellani]
MTQPHEKLAADRRTILSTLAAGLAGVAFWSARSRPAEAAERFAVQHSDAEWRRMLPAPAYDVLRHEGTERPFSSPLNDEHRAGTFQCRGCGQALYSSKTKFDSGTGWPSFWAPINGAVATKTDRSLLMSRTEVHCTRCGGHQGHVFNDGPRPTGKRYCMNGVSMTFKPA